jgi:hypothetical protein
MAFEPTMLDALQQLIAKHGNFGNIMSFPLTLLSWWTDILISGGATYRQINGFDSYGSACLQSFRDSFGPSTVRRCAGKPTFSRHHLTSTHNSFAG